MFFLYSFFENDIGDVFGGIDFGQGMCGLCYLYVVGGIFGQIVQQCGNVVGQCFVLFQ